MKEKRVRQRGEGGVKCDDKGRRDVYEKENAKKKKRER